MPVSGVDHRAVALRPKTFHVLQYLVEHAGQLVTKEELLQAVWAGTVVSDAVLKVCIRELRKILGETVHTPQFITTIHRKGYCFVAPVTRSDPMVDHASAALLPRPLARTHATLPAAVSLG